MMLARQGATNGTIVEAETQSAGRGRLGKDWLSPPGTGLYFSLILRPSLDTENVPKITLAAGLGAAQAIEKNSGLQVMLKWPNDLLLDGKKVGGILCESGPMIQAEGVIVIIGIGLNVSTPLSDFPTELRHRSTSLSSHTGKSLSKKELMLEIACQVENQVGLLEAGDFQGVLASWRSRDFTVGKNLDWLSIAGEKIRGVSLGPDEEGILRIRDESGNIHTVLSGDLSLATEE